MRCSRVQIAEFDIFITFKSDIGDHKWLIECRDRPSQGCAPVSWIEQLIGRKFLHGFDRVIAVSTTDFSSGAILCAEKGSIELRTVSEAEVPENWLCKALTVLNRAGTFKSCRVNLLSGLDQDYARSIEQNMPSNPDKIVIFLDKLKTRLSPKDLFQDLCFDDKNTIYKDVLLGKPKSVHIICPAHAETTGAMFMEFDNFRTPLESIEFSGEVRIEMNTIPLNRTEIYKQNRGKKFIGQRIIYLFDTDQEKMNFQFYDVQLENSRQISLKIDKH